MYLAVFDDTFTWVIETGEIHPWHCENIHSQTYIFLRLLQWTFFFSERKGLERFSESKGSEAIAQYTEGVKELRIMRGKRPIEKDWVVSLAYPLSDRTQHRIGKGKRVIPPPLPSSSPCDSLAKFRLDFPLYFFSFSLFSPFLSSVFLSVSPTCWRSFCFCIIRWYIGLEYVFEFLYFGYFTRIWIPQKGERYGEGRGRETITKHLPL